MRPIDADALVSMLRNGILEPGERATPFNAGIAFAESMVSFAPTIDAVPRWIPCEERLPEDGKLVLCQCRAGIIDVLRLKLNGFWENSNPYMNYMPGFVIAWMPLPEPYKGEREDNE